MDHLYTLSALQQLLAADEALQTQRQTTSDPTHAVAIMSRAAAQHGITCTQADLCA